MPIKKDSQHMITALWAVLGLYIALIFIPKLYDMVLSADLSILVAFAGRMLDGYKLSDAYYETNPPLSMIINVPVVWFSRVLETPVWHVHFFTSLFWTCLSFILTTLALRQSKLSQGMETHLLLLVFLAAAFIAPSKSFGERDHLIFLALVPFLIVQLDLMGGAQIRPFLRIPVLCLGAIAVLIKPHYGLLPTVLLAARIIQNRDWRLWQYPDFLALSGAVIGYGVVIALYFPDFATIVFPDVLELYVANRHPMVLYETSAYMLMVGLCLLAVYEFKFDEREKKICLFLALATLCFLLAYLVQGKGLNYHRIAFVSFFYATAAMTGFYVLRRFVRPDLSFTIPFFLVMAALLTFRGVPQTMMSDTEFRSYPISQALKKHCAAPCSFFMFYDTSDIIHQLQVYHGAFHASRFTSLWFLPRILKSEHALTEGEPAPISAEEIAAYKEKYFTYMAEDMEWFQPDLIFDFRDYLTYGYVKFDFMDYFSQDPRLKGVFDNYEKVDTLTFERKIYYKGFSTPFDHEGPVRFDIYKRKN